MLAIPFIVPLIVRAAPVGFPHFKTYRYPYLRFYNREGDPNPHDVREFVTPNEPLVRDLAEYFVPTPGQSVFELAEDVTKWVYDNISYVLIGIEHWLYPVEVFDFGYADCQGMANLGCSILRNFLSTDEVLSAVGMMGANLHVWNVVNTEEGSYIFDCTLGRGMGTEERLAALYLPLIYFNDKDILSRLEI